MKNDDEIYEVYDPIAEINENISAGKNKIHIRIKQRNGRKCITTIEGLKDLKLQLIKQQMKNTFHCNGAVQSDGCIMLFGDQRVNAKKFLIDNSIATEIDILMHGY